MLSAREAKLGKPGVVAAVLKRCEQEVLASIEVGKTTIQFGDLPNTSFEHALHVLETLGYSVWWERYIPKGMTQAEAQQRSIFRFELKLSWGHVFVGKE